jgi:altronate dehydratase
MNPRPLDPYVLILRPDDDVGVARQPLPAQCQLVGLPRQLTTSNPIPAGHKIALRALPADAPVRKYGQIIGFAQGAIAPGDHVHTHNLTVRNFARKSQSPAPSTPAQPLPPPADPRQFQGFQRPDGRVGTRNYLAVISSVNCSATVARYVKEQFDPAQLRRDFPQVDGIIAFTHKGGCGVQPGEPHQLLMRVLAGMARHPNIAGYVMVGLGCEVNQLHIIREQQQLPATQPETNTPLFLNIQDAGGVRKTVDRATAAMTRLLPVANSLQRTPQPLRHLTLALECGGSDAYSGITANPALGVASDELVRHGGTTVLAETPEIYGAEHLLLQRAVSPEVAQQLLDRIHWWEDHVRLHQATIDNNPAPGNKAGGLTTIYEKASEPSPKAVRPPSRPSIATPNRSKAPDSVSWIPPVTIPLA